RHDREPRGDALGQLARMAQAGEPSVLHDIVGRVLVAEQRAREPAQGTTLRGEQFRRQVVRVEHRASSVHCSRSFPPRRVGMRETRKTCGARGRCNQDSREAAVRSNDACVMSHPHMARSGALATTLFALLPTRSAALVPAQVTLESVEYAMEGVAIASS